MNILQEGWRAGEASPSNDGGSVVAALWKSSFPGREAPDENWQLMPEVARELRKARRTAATAEPVFGCIMIARDIRRRM
jgi:hypothetical protein